MALIDVQCSMGHVREVSRPALEWPSTPPCPDCGGPTSQVHLPRGYSFLADPVVVYQAPDGSFRFPGDTRGAGSAKYDRMGYTRIEARSFAEVRSLEKRITEHDRVASLPIREGMAARDEHREHARRSELYHCMAGMSPLSRDIARAAIERNNKKPRRTGSGSTYVEAYE